MQQINSGPRIEPRGTPRGGRERRIQPALMATILARSIWVEKGDVGGLETRPLALSPCQVCANLLGMEPAPLRFWWGGGVGGRSFFYFFEHVECDKLFLCISIFKMERGAGGKGGQEEGGREREKDGGRDGELRRGQRRSQEKRGGRREEEGGVHVCVFSQTSVRIVVFTSD